MSEEYLPIPRKYKPGQKATLEDLRWARKIVAELLEIEPLILPIFQRLDKEITKRESDLLDVERARLIAKNGLQNGLQNGIPFLIHKNK